MVMGGSAPRSRSTIGSMMLDPADLIRDFAVAAESAKIKGWSDQLLDELRHDKLLARHVPPKLPPGFGAVYAFALGATAGVSAPCRAGCVLKVGRVGATNGNRVPVLPLQARRSDIHASTQSCNLPDHVAMAGDTSSRQQHGEAVDAFQLGSRACVRPGRQPGSAGRHRGLRSSPHGQRI
jgi:hypothetical protein